MTADIINGDCIDILSRLPAGWVQLVFADPPYNFGFDYGNGRQADRLSDSEYLAWCERWLAECQRVLLPSGSLWVLVPERWADHIGLMLSNLLPRVNRIIWREQFGQYRQDRFAGGHRHLFYHADPKLRVWAPDSIRVPSVRMQMGDKRAAGPRVPDDVWEVSRLQGNCRERVQWHPCQLREWPLERIIRVATNAGDVVLDPFAGSGTTLAVAQRLGRRFLGIDQNPDYCNGIRGRLATESCNTEGLAC
jgi:site-specific DNA-methyltransferase (adenine-specific)